MPTLHIPYDFTTTGMLSGGSSTAATGTGTMRRPNSSRVPGLTTEYDEATSFCMAYPNGTATGGVTAPLCTGAHRYRPPDMPTNVTIADISFGIYFYYASSTVDDSILTTFGTTNEGPWVFTLGGGTFSQSCANPSEPWSKPLPTTGGSTSGYWLVRTFPVDSVNQASWRDVINGWTSQQADGWSLFAQVSRVMGADHSDHPVEYLFSWLTINYESDGTPTPPGRYIFAKGYGQIIASGYQNGWGGFGPYAFNSTTLILSKPDLGGVDFSAEMATWKAGDRINIYDGSDVLQGDYGLSVDPVVTVNSVQLEFTEVSVVRGMLVTGQGFRLEKKVVAPNGTGSLSASVTLSGGGDRSSAGTGDVSAAVALTGSGTATRQGSGDLAATVALTGSGGLPSVNGSGTGDVSAAVALAGSGQRLASGTGAVSAAVALAGSGQRLASGTGDVSAAVALAGSGQRLASGAGDVSAAVALAGSGQRLASGTGALAVTVDLTGSGAIVGGAGTGSGHLTVAADLTGSGTTIRLGTGLLPVTVDLLGSGQAQAPAFSGTGVLTAAVELLAQGITLRSGFGTLTALVELAGTGADPAFTYCEMWNGTAWVGVATFNGTGWVDAEVWNPHTGRWQKLSAAP